ncbi:pseudouridine synthase [Gilvimarinus sp. DA14]|uniref:pseudouridine synthase n=1 Tax=Gilvimarinus sp. DA14 TaxID=2956798 RepID=UPI0020B77FC6|nr:pseudouridine synthase [Gilvimarinus sp. DA14]UTF61012.1 pseudouridine synthase [Gilvimarinus sp. DA14]
MRLDKFIAHATFLPRSEVKKLLKRGEISVDGKTTTQGSHQLSGKEEIKRLGERLHLPKARYFMLHKPKGVVCANQDPEHPTALDCLQEPNKESLQIAGRLDKDTTGMLLLTDDGQWNHRVTSPAQHKTKTYWLRTADPLDENLIQHFASGIQLKDEPRPCRPAQLTLLDVHTARLKISEGKYHQVKRMFAACGNHVLELHREAIGSVALDKNLQPGHYRPLSEWEVKQLGDTNA